MIPLFQRVPHIGGSQSTSDDIHLSSEEEADFFSRELIIQEKLDGVAASIMKSKRGKLLWGLRPPWEKALHGAISRSFDIYMLQREPFFLRALPPDTVLFCEWLRFQLGIFYDQLPSFLYCNGVRIEGKNLPFQEMEDVCSNIPMALCKPLFVGRLKNKKELFSLQQNSAVGNSEMEGFILRTNGVLEQRMAKWVAESFHKVGVSKVPGERNRLRRDVEERFFPTCF